MLVQLREFVLGILPVGKAMGREGVNLAGMTNRPQKKRERES